MHFVGDRLPRLNLFIGPYAGSRRPAQAFLGDARCFGDDEAGVGALSVIFGLQLGNRHMLVDASASGQGCHQDAVRRTDRAKVDGIEKARCHKSSCH